jgi:predicted trehalose synthase
MLRSFSYARAVVEQDLSPDSVERELLQAWERRARNAFVSGYWAMLTSNRPDSGVSLIPRSENSFMRALSAWEADKALYEVAYEARNRPDWIGIPLRALLPDLFV